MTDQQSKKWLTLICLLYLGMALCYGIITPIFEAPDEHHHYFTAEVIATTNQLPTVNDPFPRQEAAQPPLAYLISAAILKPLSLDGVTSRDAVWFNPFATPGDASNPININAFVHDPAVESFPYQGHVLGVRLLRIVSSLIGLGTLLLIYAGLRQLWPDEHLPALIGAALVGFLPQFGFVHAAVSNDPHIIFLATAGLVQLLKIAGSAKTPSTRQLILLGVTIGLASLTKNQGVLLLALAGGLLGWLAIFGRNRTLLWKAPLFVALPALLMVVPLWWRNWQLYGDFTATNQFIRLAGGDRNFTLAQIWGERGQLWTSLIGSFGWQNINAPSWLYRLWMALGLVGLAGWVQAIWQRQRHLPGRQIGWLFLWLLLVVGAWLSFMLQTSAAQGRLLFPALLTLAAIFGGGLAQFRSQKIAAAAGLVALATAVYCVGWLIPRAFAAPQTFPDLPDSASALAIDFAGVRLIGFESNSNTLSPSDYANFTLYWQRTGEVELDPVEVELIGRNFQSIGKSVGYHGRGQYPASLWPEGAIVADQHLIQVHPEAEPFTLVRPFVKLLSAENAVQAGEFKLVPDELPAIPTAGLVNFGNVVNLVSADIATNQTTPGSTVTVNLTWHVRADVETDYTTFVHLFDRQNAILKGQGDAPPRQGDYPTRVWQADETFTDSYQVRIFEDAAAGDYPLLVGLYDPITGERLQIILDFETLGGDSFEIGSIAVTE